MFVRTRLTGFILSELFHRNAVAALAANRELWQFALRTREQ